MATEYDVEVSGGAFNPGGLNFAVIFGSFDVTLVNSLLDSSDRLIGERVILKYCTEVSVWSVVVVAEFHLQNVSSSSVRLYVSGYMKYTNVNSNVIHPQ